MITKHYAGDDSDLPTLMNGLAHRVRRLTTEDYAERAGRLFAHAVASAAQTVVSRNVVTRPWSSSCAISKPMGSPTISFRAADAISCVRSPRELYGIPPERVVGSSVALEFRGNGDGGDVVTQAHSTFWTMVRRNPRVSGAASGNVPFLRRAIPTAIFPCSSLPTSRRALPCGCSSCTMMRRANLITSAGAEKSLQLAKQYGWTIVSMKNDWKTVFARYVYDPRCQLVSDDS